MSHLTTDRFAAIADDTPTAEEATHLAGCWECRAELAAYRRLVRLSAMAPLPSEPLTAWSQLAPQLRAEGILVDARRADVPMVSRVPLGGAPAVSLADRRPRLQVWALRAAAAVALVVAGAAAGRFTAPERRIEDVLSQVPRTASASFQSNDDAIRALAVAQQQYQNAAAFLAGQDTASRFIGMNQDSYQARLAALDEIAAAARAALYRAPQDPMLNQYYLTTLGAREATLKQISATAPTQRRLDSY